MRVGTSGLYVSRLALGMMSFGDTSKRRWVLEEAAAEPIVRRAVEGEITFFDTADTYAGGASELVTGRLLRKLISRDEAVVATKVFYREEEREMIPLCLDQRVGIVPYSPLARGLLAGTRTREGEPRTTRAESDPVQDELYGRMGDADVIDRVAELAAERGVAPAQIALAWLLHRPGVTAPIVGATKIEHVEDALAATELTLSREEISQLEQPYLPHPVLD